MKYRCPVCRSNFTGKEKAFPFCSEKCQAQDLGKWATGAYAIPAVEPPTENEMQSILEELEEEGGTQDTPNAHWN